MRTARTTMIIALSVVAVALPTAAGACDAGPGPSAGPDLSAAYLYRKVDASAPASWENSGPQTRFSLRDGHSWLESIDRASLPGDVCGPGWAVQEDRTHGIEEVPTSVDRVTHTNVLGWPPIVNARHRNLEAYVDVPECVVAEVPVVPQVPVEEVVLSGGDPVVMPPVIVVAGAAVPVAASPRFTG